MGRRSNNSGDDVSLFPFLSVLACVIGTLAMVIAMIVVRSLDNETIDQAIEYQEKQQEFDETSAELARLKDELKKREDELDKTQSQKRKSLEQSKQRLADVLAQLKETEQQLAAISIEGPKVNVAVETEQIAEMQAELKQRKESIAQMTAEIDERNLPPEESEVSILPGGSGIGFVPKFIECDNGRIVIHDGAKQTPVRTAELNTNPDFAKVLDEVLNNEKKTLVFLVRDDGLVTYRTARDFANTKGVRNGKLPVIGDGRIDLSYFKKQAKDS